MKNLILLLLACLASSLFAQSRQDTVYHSPGKIANIKHFSKMDLATASKAELFMRGLSFGDEAWELDSISVFNTNGEFLRTRPISELDRPSVKTSSLIKKEREEALREGDIFSSSDVINVFGYAGTQATTTLKFKNSSQASIPFQLISTPSNIHISGPSQPISEQTHELTIAVDLTSGISQQVVRLAGAEGKVYDVRLALRGYDLTEADFLLAEGSTQLKELDAQVREYIYLRLQSTEKLLNLYQGDKLLYRIPVGRQIDQVPVYHLPSGNYRMEIINLSTGQKRSCRLKR